MTRKRSTDGNNVSRVRLSSDAKVADEYERKTARRKETGKRNNNKSESGGLWKRWEILRQDVSRAHAGGFFTHYTSSAEIFF